MNRFIKITSIILIQAFLLAEFVHTGNAMEFIDKQKGYLSPQIHISSAEIQQIFLKDMPGMRFQPHRKEASKKRVIASENEADAALSTRIFFDEYIANIIACLNQGCTDGEIYKYVKELHDILSEHNDIKVSAFQLKELIKLMNSTSDGWVDTAIHITIAQALFNNMRLLKVFFSEMESALGTVNEEDFFRVLFVLEQRSVNLKLDFAQARMFIRIIKQVDNALVKPILTAFLSKAVYNKPSLAALVVDAAAETVNTENCLEFYNVLFKASSYRESIALKQKQFDILVNTIEKNKNLSAQVKGITVVTKLLANNKRLNLTGEQINLLVAVIKGIKINAQIIPVFSEFFKEVFLHDKTMLDSVARQVGASMARIYYLIALKEISKIKPDFVRAELMERMLDDFNLNVLGVLISNSGTTPTLVSYYAEILLNSAERLNIEGPADFPKLKKQAESFTISKANFPFDLDFNQTENLWVLGRTLIFKNKDEYYAVKLMKEKETEGMLYYEHEVMDWVKVKKENKEIKLQNDYPQAVRINGHRVLNIDVAQFPEEARKKLRKVAKEDGKYKVSERNGKYTFICYKVSEQ